jgi:hypothetical protein
VKRRPGVQGRCFASGGFCFRVCEAGRIGYIVRNREVPVAAATKLKTKKSKLLSRARSEVAELTPIVQRALAKHGRAGHKVYVVTRDSSGAWVRVSSTGRVMEGVYTPAGSSNARVARKK